MFSLNSLSQSLPSLFHTCSFPQATDLSHAVILPPLFVRVFSAAARVGVVGLDWSAWLIRKMTFLYRRWGKSFGSLLRFCLFGVQCLLPQLHAAAFTKERNSTG